MSFPTGGGGGNWVRARNPEGVTSFLAEQQQDADRHAEEYGRSLAFRRRLRRRLRSRLASLLARRRR
ncbi:MAG TPA: hypothetical protein VFL99_16715 [Segeticoccus sp.]|uniref:hypothetical protein n=1 Tax=Segeticoccus sp. TaxID=2706531 RepID=UPI002D80115E|nr:hypothetical protein [Segeticoccus sp.]HET8601969.1 hypothetical protein [Segeticoccus sp.]